MARTHKRPRAGPPCRYCTVPKVPKAQITAHLKFSPWKRPLRFHLHAAHANWTIASPPWNVAYVAQSRWSPRTVVCAFATFDPSGLRLAQCAWNQDLRARHSRFAPERLCSPVASRYWIRSTTPCVHVRCKCIVAPMPLSATTSPLTPRFWRPTVTTLAHATAVNPS